MSYLKIRMKVLYFVAILVLPCCFGNDEPHECRRKCLSYAPPKTCVYNFKVEWYRTLSKACWDCPLNETHCSLPHCISADGNIRSLITINRQFPGPPIEVCEGDTVVVYVTNLLEDGGAVTVHWHGLHMRDTQYMDGVPMLTQCSILQFNTFRYEFKASPAGTHWYHSHSGLQREEGLYGSVVVRETRYRDVHSHLYDYDLYQHTFIVSDWNPQPATNRFLELNHRRNSIQPLLPLSGLINGKNPRYKVQVSEQESAYTPPEVFSVRAGGRYRFRMIAATGESCQFRVSVDKHRLKAIAGDGASIRPVVADTITIAPGERHDFILTADQAVGNYWMRALCRTRFGKINVLAVVRYEGAGSQLPLEDANTEVSTGKMLFGEKFEDDDSDTTYIGVGEMQGAANENFMAEKVDIHYTMKLAMNNNDNTRFHHPEFYPIKEMSGTHFTQVIDNITFTFPKVPLLSQWEDAQPSWFCNQSTIRFRDCYSNLCRCTHMVQLPKNKVVEITFVNIYEEGISGSHFMHLHGNYYRVMANGKIGTDISVDRVNRMKADGRIRLRYTNPIYRDTVTVAGGGYMVIRMKTDNPGVWLFHCHKKHHSELGQSLIFKIGDKGDWGEPPENFPKCGSFGTPDAPEVCSVSSGSSCSDSDAGFCSRIRARLCYNENMRKKCCYTCSKIHFTGIQGCEYGDRKPNCNSQSQCRQNRNLCCQTCRSYPQIYALG